MKRILYVDFENVSSAGLTGMSDLTTDDEVKIFLGPKCSKMSLIEADNIFHGDATVELIKNDQIAKNALDFIIMVHLGYDVAKKAGDLFFIISNDKGYDPAIHEMQVMTGETIARYQDIAQVIKRNDVKPGLLARLFGRKKVETTDDTANATEHEVLKKGHRSRTNGTSGSYGNRSNGARDGYRNGGRTEGNRGNGNRNGRGNGYGSNGANGGSGRNGYNTGSGRNGSNGSSRNTSRRTSPDTTLRSASSNAGSTSSNAGSVNAVNVNVAQNNGSHPASVQSEQKKVVHATVAKDDIKKPAAVNETAKTAEASNEKKGNASNERAVAASKETNISIASMPKNVLSHEDDYLDGMSIAELRAQLKGDKKNNGSTNVEKNASSAITAAAASAKNASASKSESSARSSASHKSHGRAKTVLSDSEKALVERAVAETDNLGDFHNYLLKELRDNDRATEIYKAEKHRVKIVRPEKTAEKNGSEKAAGEKPATEAQNQSVENTENVIS